ncbi:MAG TPA: 50S ribosomal protein L16 [Elusimicrobiales bacterium]|nr:50S ribosomal protein L16 [Elusimicrobiales bacterium]
MPKRVKHRKTQTKPKIKRIAKRGTKVAFGDYGIKALAPRWITARQIESARITLTRFIKKQGKVWIRIFPDKVITKKPAETRMGKGKGAPDHWVSVVEPGRILFEMEGISLPDAKRVTKLVSAKLPISVRLVVRGEGGC